MNVLKKVAKKVENSKIVKNPKFLVIGLIIIVSIIALIYFIFLKYSPIMNFKYEGYAISGKEITENLLSGDSSDNNANKNIELTKIEEQGTIFKKLNNYFVGNREKTEINLNYPIYINGNSSLYNLSEGSTLISKNFEEISSYPNLSISEGKIYDGNNLERADAKEYIFVKTTDNIYANLYEIKINTTANEYIIPVNSIISFTENTIRYYSVNNNVLVFNQINDIDNNSNVEMAENNYIYKELLTRLGILQEESNNTESSNSQENIIQENTANKEIKDDNETNNNEQQNTDNNTTDQNSYIKPEVTAENFTAEVYTAKSTLHIKDPSGRIVEAPTFEIYKDGKIYLRRTFSNSGEIQITGLVPDTEYEVVGKYIYLNENDQKVENTFYEGKFTTKGYDQLGSIEIQKENGEIYSNKIQLTKVKITSDLNAEVLKGVNQVEIETGEIRTVLKNNQVNELLQGKEITIESSEGLKSDSKINYVIRFYDNNGVELKVNNNEGETRTSKEAPTVRVNIKEQDIVNVTLGLKLTNRDNVKLENYKYVVTRPNGEVVQEKKLSENESELLLEDLDQNQYYKISIYADYDLNDNRGKQEQVEIGNLVFATQPISTLGSLELTVENKELTSTTSMISYKINEDRTDKRLIQILNELTINIKDGENIVKTDTLTEEEITNLQQAGTKEIKYENLKSNTTYTIEITGKVQLGNTQEEVPITYNYKEFTTLKNTAKIEIRNQFVTGNLIDFDIRIEDIDNSVLNNTVRMELRDEDDTLIRLEELETNQDYVRKTYEKLEENKTYKLRFIADQYNEGSTDATYKANYLIKEIEIITEPGVSGRIGLTELTKKATGKNLIDVNSKIKWYVWPVWSGDDYYGKEYDVNSKELTLGALYNKMFLYDLREYAGQEITISFEAKLVQGETNGVRLVNGDRNNAKNMLINGLTDDWQEYQYVITLDKSGYLGFSTSPNTKIKISKLQVELGNKKTSYEEFKYILQSSYNINLEDKRDEIATNDYYIKIYEDNNLVREDRYEEILEENIITNAIKTYETQSGKQYKVELVIKLRDREYVLSELEYNTQDTEEIKGIYNKDEFLEIQPEGHYIVLDNIDLKNETGIGHGFGGERLAFEGKIDFNGYKIIRNTESTSPIFYNIGEKAIIENFVLEVYLDNEVEISNYRVFFRNNNGTIKNFKVVLEECTNKPNKSVKLLGSQNYGIVENFILESKVSLYGSRDLTLGVGGNYGTIKNGYAYGENIKGIYSDDSGNRDIGGVLNNNSGIVRNIFSLINIDVAGKVNAETSGNIMNHADKILVTENLYSVGYGENYSLSAGPTIGYANSDNLNKIKNVYYFADITFNNSYNRKTTPLALWDTTFQNQLLNDESAFNVDELVTQGYYPQLNWPDCMPTQEYIELPEVEDKDLPDILSMEILESTKDTAKVKFSVNNPSAETITKIIIKNLQCTIESQEYNDGKSEVIAILNNPIICVSQYSVMSISTKGAYNQEYTRDFAENERLIDVDFYREINTTDDWKNINKSPTENYILMQDLDFRNNAGASLISVDYTGKFDGNNHTVKNINSSYSFIFTKITNEIKNIYFENITINSNAAVGIISTGNNLENVYAKNVTIINKSNSTNTTGGLVGIQGNYIKNCGVNNITIINNSYSSNFRLGALIGVATNSKVNNCYATNVNIQTKNTTYQGLGGLIGTTEGTTEINNCYVEGNIEIDGTTVGGIVGRISNSTKLNNSYSYVSITGNVTEAGGIAGVVSAGKIGNNIALGNLYTSQLDTTLARIAGSGTLTATNYAYSNQRLNGLIETTTGTNIELLTPEELLTQTTYANILNYGNAYDYSQLGENILPKLHKINEDGTYSNELLPNQEDIYLDISNEFKIDSVEIEKNAVDQIAGQIVVINTNEEEVTGLEIDGMDVTVTSIITRDGKSYINITAKPNKFYDTYKITKVKYREEGQAKEQEVEGKIEVQFYKELYNFEDWQEIEDGTYQNYRLMSDIDFAGRTNIKTNVTMARLEAVGGTKSLKNIDLTFNEAGSGLIKDITTKLSDIRFENINIQYNVNSYSNDKAGIIINSSADMSNLEFSEAKILGEKINYVGAIGYVTSSYVENIKLDNITVKGNGFIGSFLGQYETNSIKKFYNVEADEVEVTGGYNNIGGLIGRVNSSSYIGKIEKLLVKNSNISGKNYYTGGVIGYQDRIGVNNIVSERNNISGKLRTGGAIGANNTRVDNVICNNLTITATDDYIGGLIGEGGQLHIAEVNNCIITSGINSDNVGGAFGDLRWSSEKIKVSNTNINASGNNIGGISGSTASTIHHSIFSGNIVGNNNVGGIIGNITSSGIIYLCYSTANIEANSNVGALVGYLNNTGMTAVSNTSSLYVNYAADTTVEGKSNVGGIFGNIAEELYMPETYYYSNYVEVYLNSEDNTTISLGIGGKQNQNQYLANTYYYKYSTINGKNPNEQNEVFISSDKYLIEEELKAQTTYTSKLSWGSNNWDFTSLEENKYPLIKDLTNQEGIDIPTDSEHIIENDIEANNIETETLIEEPEKTFEYNNKEIQTYSTYSVITSIDGNNVTRNAKLYVKDNNLYAIPSILSTDAETEVIPVANNIILDSYNGKEYETVLGSDGRIYDLKEPITYPENFVNSDIESIGNNLNSDVKEVEVKYKNGDKVKFNYQTGEVILSEKVNSTNSTESLGLFDYIKEKISELGENSDDELSTELTTKYQESKELQNKLEDTSVEEAIENQNYNSQTLENFINNTEETTTETNNSLKENKYISMYNEETGEYEIYNEEELLDTNKEEVVSENEKIEANNLSEYYASEGETRSTKMGIVWIVISIIGVGIILIILKKNLKKKA